MRYTLDDGEQIHREAPDTFWIPDAAERTLLRPGQIVKLIFRIETEGEVHVERMWVMVKEQSPSGYIGELDNDPCCTTELRSGALVSFEPRHVIDIYKDRPEAWQGRSTRARCGKAPVTFTSYGT